MTADYTRRVLDDIAAERDAQDAKWGVQRIADNDGDDDGTMLLGRPYAVWERILKHTCDSRRAQWLAGGDDVRNMTVATLEEVFECLTAAVRLRTDNSPVARAAFRTEAVQAAAMFAKWVEIHDYNDAVADYAAFDADPAAWREANTVDGVRPHTPVDPDAVPSPPWMAALTITPDEIDANYLKDLLGDAPLPARHMTVAPPPMVVSPVHVHDYDRLHGLCRCGEPRPLPEPACACGQPGCDRCDPEGDM